MNFNSVREAENDYRQRQEFAISLYEIVKNRRRYVSFWDKRQSCSTTWVVHNLEGIDLPEDFREWYDYTCLPGTDLWVKFPYNGSGIVEIYLEVFDYALPQNWWDDFYAKNGFAPRGVWSYDENKLFGEYVSWYDLLARFTSDVVEQVYFDRKWREPVQEPLIPEEMIPS